MFELFTSLNQRVTKFVMKYRITHIQTLLFTYESLLSKLITIKSFTPYSTTWNETKASSTNDESLAKSNMQALEHNIYEEFEDAHLEYANCNSHQTNKYYEIVIYGLAKALKCDN